MTIILGTNGTGKTTLLKRILTMSGQRALVVTPHIVEWHERTPSGADLYPLNELKQKSDYIFNGIQRHIWDPKRTLNCLQSFKKGILVFDDCRAYLQSTTDPRMRTLLISMRQQEIDIFAVGHGFNEVPPVFFTFATDLFLFKTRDNMIRRQNCIQCYDEVAELQQRVNAEANRIDPVTHQPNRHYYQYIRFS